MPNKSRFTLLLTSLTLSSMLLMGCTGPDGDPAKGKRWFDMHHCYACHGENGNDGRATQISAIDMSFRSFTNYLRNPDSPSMPKYSEEKLSNEDAADIYVWLKSIPE